jgi:hypothetical protein
LASGILSYSTGLSAFDFANKYLFRPLGFRNAEWMHQDSTGINMGGYGLRLRPIDMQKLGILYLQNGKWRDRQIVSPEWIFKTTIPYTGYGGRFEYGFYWWSLPHNTMVKWQNAIGWKGQRISINYEQDVVVTMTACIEDGSEDGVFAKIMRDYVVPSIYPGSKPKRHKNYDWILKSVGKGPLRTANIESRMVPSKQAKEKAIRFTPR